MTRNKKISSILLCFVFLTFIGCGNKFQVPNELTSQNPTNNENQTNEVPTTNLENINFKGFVEDNGEYNQKAVIDFDKTNGNFILKLPLPFGVFLGAIDLPISSLPGASMTTITDSTGTYLALSVPAKYILKGIDFLPSDKLPNGDKLPSIPSGELPTVALSLPNNEDVRVHLYLGVNVLGAFLEINQFKNPRLGIIKRITLPVKSEDGKKIIGYFTIVGPTNNYPGGIFISTPIPDQLAKFLDDHFSL